MFRLLRFGMNKFNQTISYGSGNGYLIVYTFYLSSELNLSLFLDDDDDDVEKKSIVQTVAQMFSDTSFYK